MQQLAVSGGVQQLAPRPVLGRGVGGVEGLMRAEPAEQLSGTSCLTISLCLFRRGSLDPLTPQQLSSPSSSPT